MGTPSNRKKRYRKTEKHVIQPQNKKPAKQRGKQTLAETKIAALKDAEAREEMELNKPLKAFAEKKEEKQTETRTKSPRKQVRPRKSLARLPERKTNPEINEAIDSSSDEEENTMWQETTTKQDTADKTEGTIEEQQNTPETSSNISMQSQRTKRKPNWFGQNVMVTKVDAKDGEDKNGTQSKK